MRKIIFTTAMIACLGLSALGQKDQDSNKPMVDQTQSEWDQRATDVKQRTGKTIRLEKRAADPKRRGGVKIRCYTLDPYGWELAFGQKTDYGGVVCVRSR